MNQLLCIGDPSQSVMAESKGSLIAKSVSKHAGRAKEKVKGLRAQRRSFIIVTYRTILLLLLLLFSRRRYDVRRRCLLLDSSTLLVTCVCNVPFVHILSINFRVINDSNFASPFNRYEGVSSPNMRSSRVGIWRYFFPVFIVDRVGGLQNFICSSVESRSYKCSSGAFATLPRHESCKYHVMVCWVVHD